MSLERSDLDSANLDSANLDSANLDSANLDSANLDSANLDSANLVCTSRDNALMCMKTYRTNGEVLVAVCDHDLLGRSFQEGRLQIEVYPEFYGRERATPDEVEKAIAGATIANLVGKISVGCAARLQYVSEDTVLFIGGIPCAQIVRM